MKLIEQSSWMLAPLELCLCMQILGDPAWEDVPVEDDGRPLESRMLDGFVRLAELGLLEAGERGYRKTELMEKRLASVAEPDRKMILFHEGRPVFRAYVKGDRCTCLEYPESNSLRCVISAADWQTLFSKVKDHLNAAVTTGPLTLEILAAKGWSEKLLCLPREKGNWLFQAESGRTLPASAEAFEKLLRGGRKYDFS